MEGIRADTVLRARRASEALLFHGRFNESDLDRLLERHGVDRWAFITAWNPKSIELPRQENDRRQAQLLSRLANYIVVPGEGVGRDVTWAPEPSLLVLGISRKDAIRLGRAFEQLAIVAGHKGFPARLLPCSPLPTPSWNRTASSDGDTSVTS